MISQIIFSVFCGSENHHVVTGYVDLSNAIHMAWHNNVIAINYLRRSFAEHVVNTDKR